MSIAARALKLKDRVGIIAPGTRPESPRVVSYAVRVLDEMGFIPIVGDSVLNVHGHFAGTDEQRASDINKFVTDESIRGIFCITGGFGSLPLLPYIDFESIRTSRKLFIGNDENTPLLVAIHGQAGVRCILGPNLDRVRSARSFDCLKEAVTQSKLSPLKCAGVKLGETVEISDAYSSVEGAASGALIGGNLSALISMMGTPFSPNLDDAVLYLDDFNERIDILDRWFTTLYISGDLQKVAGVAFGGFYDCGSRGNTNILSLEDLFGERLKELNKPNLFGFPTGHIDSSASIPFGIDCRFDTTTGELEFLSEAIET